MEKNINKQELENKEQELNEKELEKVSGGQIQPQHARGQAYNLEEASGGVLHSTMIEIQEILEMLYE